MSENPYSPACCPRCGAGLRALTDTIVCEYCGALLYRGQPRPGQDAETWVEGLRLQRFRCPDPQGIGLDAFEILIPSGWQTQGGVFWQTNNPGSPARIYFQAGDPLGYLFTIFPHQPCFWSTDPMMRLSFPPGSQYFGNEVRPPVPAAQALRELVLPRFRAIPGLQVTGETHLPDLPARMSALGPPQAQAQQADGAMLSLAYTLNGQPFEEEIYGTTQYNTQHMPAMFGSVSMVNWTADYLIGFKAPAGRLAASRTLFQTMLRSFSLNLDWFARLTEISQYLIQNQIQNIRDIGEVSRYVSRVNNQISDTIVQGYNQRQQVMDRINQRFSQSIRGVDGYYDPHKGSEVELPGGYRHAWANALGEYIVSDSASYNPNIGSNSSWTEINKQC